MNAEAVAWAMQQMPDDVPAKLVLISMAAEAEVGPGSPPWWWKGSPFNVARLTAQCGLTERQMAWALHVLDEGSLARAEALSDGVIYRLALYSRQRWVAETVKNHAPVPAPLRRAVFERDGHRCVRCGSADRLHADHIYPRWLGGLNLLVNLQTLCATCNRAKGLLVDGP